MPSDLPLPRVQRALERLDFLVARQGAKHTVFQHRENPDRTLVIPRHSRIKRKLLRDLLKGVAISEEHFMAKY